jgi:quercetin dioxygenase-like cupin family protein
MTYTYPHTIENGSGEELTFLKLVQRESGELLEVENKVQPGSGPPMHIHWLQEESLTVVQGKLGAEIPGQPATFHGPGEIITFHRGVAHRFWNAGDEVLICKGWVTPPNNLVYFLSKIYESTKANGGHRPSAFDGAFLQTKYQSEFDMVGIPKFVKKVVFPIVLALGKLMGKHRKFADAPQPVR